MRSMKRSIPGAGHFPGMLVVAGLVLAPNVAGAQQGGHMQGGSEDMHGESKVGHSHEMALLHGGQVIMTETNHFEVLFTDEGIRVYAYDSKQAPIPVLTKTTGTATLMTKTGKPITLELAYQAPDADHGRTQGYLFAAHDFGETEADAMKAMISIKGMEEAPILFKTAVMHGAQAMYACPMNDTPSTEDPGSCPKCGMTMKRMQGMQGESPEHESHGKHGGH